MKKKLVVSLTLGFFMAGMVASGQATTFSIDTVDGDWTNPVPNVTINNSGSTGGLSTARWGVAAGGQQSGYDFLSIGTPVNAESGGAIFSLGTFTHQNWPISSLSLDAIDLNLTVSVGGLFNIATVIDFDHNETPNSLGGSAANDIVTVSMPTINQQFVFNGEDYFFELYGFSQDGGTTIASTFSTIERQANTATLYARITEVPPTGNAIPEPTTLLLVGTGVAALFGARRIRRAS